ncbi:MAG: trmJ [Gammaproteobacteria bacterium]|jgi:tRNA (cytidine32/uridine32-2'-O)-methyltransferase|nr:trmJ [Gammaproteobacteria bacterium]MCE3237111.1 trmJ [Gammaproteobacteria bacterium]
MLGNIRIVLVNTSHPGNIGAAARAMKTMGLKTLYLVAPHAFPHDKATEMAVGAADLLDKAVVVNELAEAIADCSLVVGTSARSRTIPWPMLTPRAFAEKAIAEAVHHKIAVILGPEQSGLTNDELHRCHFHLQIPCHPDYTSLNVAAAVQVIAYELYIASLDKTVPEVRDYDYATAESMQNFYEHLERVLINIDFLNIKAPRQLMTRLQRLFNRARPDAMEVNILRGILGAVENQR